MLAKIMSCRRSLIAAFGITCLTAIALYNGTDTSVSIAAIAMGVAGANAYQGKKGESDVGER